LTGFSLDRLLAPASVAVVGASERPETYACQALVNLAEIGYAGRIWGVNPGRTQVFGHPCVPSVEDLPEAVDAVVVAIPAVGVPDVIEQAGARGCGGAVVFSAGFGEVPGGRDLQRRLVEAAHRHAMPVCGPNCNGLVAMHERSALWGDAFAPREPGSVAMISQSGNVAVNALNTSRGLRLHTLVASGNQAVLHAADWLEALAGRDGVRAIALYLEEDGGPALCDGIAACCDAGVGVAIHKVGSSPEGAQAAAAHSAALAGDQRVFRALVNEAGAAWADDVHELLELAKTLATPVRARGGRRMAIMTCSGGDSAQGADETQSSELELPRFAASTAQRLSELLPSAATAANPLDYTAMIWGDREALAELIRAVGDDPSVDQVLVFYDQPHGMTGESMQSWAAVRDGIIEGARRNPVPTIVSSTLPELLDDESAWRFIEAGIPAIAGLRTGVLCAAALAAGVPGEEQARRLRAISAAAVSISEPDADADAGGEGAGEERRASRPWLSEHHSKELLRAAGVPVVEGRAVHGTDDAAVALAELGGRIAMKLSAPSIQHKSELGGVLLGIDSPRAAREAYERLSAIALRFGEGAVVLAERMAPGGLELLVAAHTDGIVPAVVVGIGGIWTEILDDVAVVPLPADADRIERALRSLRGAPLLTGNRGRAPVDVAAVAELAARAGELLLARGLSLVECNPVFVGAVGEGALAVDASIRLGSVAAGPVAPEPQETTCST
jgi:acetyl-CoA synthetase